MAETYVASVNGTEYATLAEAFAAVQAGETITLLADVDLGSASVTNAVGTKDAPRCAESGRLQHRVDRHSYH